MSTLETEGQKQLAKVRALTILGILSTAVQQRLLGLASLLERIPGIRVPRNCTRRELFTTAFKIGPILKGVANEPRHVRLR